MSKINVKIILFVLLMFCSVAMAEQKTEYVFNEFRVSVSDEYMTYPKKSVLEINGSNAIVAEQNMYLDYFDVDEMYYLDAVHYETGDEISVCLQAFDSGVDFRMFHDYSDKYMQVVADEFLEAFKANGQAFSSAYGYYHPQTMYIAFEGRPYYNQGYTIMYYTVAKINNTFYNVTITGVSANGTITPTFLKDIQDVVGSVKMTGYADFEVENTSKKVDGFLSDFRVFDGISFGKALDEVIEIEAGLGNDKGIIYSFPIWMRAMTSSDMSIKSVDYNNITILGIDHSSKSYQFDENDIFYSVFYEFRSGYDEEGFPLNLDGQTEIQNFLPAYNQIELLLRDQYGNPHYQMSKGTKCDIKGYGMNSLEDWMEYDTFKELCDYSEWLIDDSQGKVKIEHILFSAENFYRHNVTMEIVR